jgi:ribosomal protein L34E
MVCSVTLLVEHPVDSFVPLVVRCAYCDRPLEGVPYLRVEERTYCGKGCCRAHERHLTREPVDEATKNNQCHRIFHACTWV